MKYAKQKQQKQLAAGQQQQHAFVLKALKGLMTTQARVLRAH